MVFVVSLLSKESVGSAKTSFNQSAKQASEVSVSMCGGMVPLAAKMSDDDPERPETGTLTVASETSATGLTLVLVTEKVFLC